MIRVKRNTVFNFLPNFRVKVTPSISTVESFENNWSEIISKSLQARVHNFSPFSSLIDLKNNIFFFCMGQQRLA